MVRIIGTPFKSRDIIAGRRTNRIIQKRIAITGLTKREIALRNIKDKINSNNLPRTPRPGTIE